MQKIFFAAAILSYNFCYAQQNDTFDVKKYLENKSIQEKLEITKPLLRPGCGTHNLDTRSFIEFLFNVSYSNRIYVLAQKYLTWIVADWSKCRGLTPPLRQDIPLFPDPNYIYLVLPKPRVLTQEQLNKLSEKYRKAPISKRT